jgi:tRNA 2-thiouridine synthesizing protein A
MNTPAEVVVDVRGRCCPVPIIEARRAMARCTPGSVVRVLATDPGFPKDLEAFCQQTGNRIVDFVNADDHYVYVLQRQP